MKLLHIDSSISGEASASRQLSSAITAEFARRIRNLEVVHRDLDADPIPHLHSDTLAEALAGGDVLQEFLDADVVVIGAPMYNFGVPSQLKAWFDRIVIAGKTFRYTESGPEGLAGGKRVVIASSRGGLYGPDGSPNDFQETYLRAVLSFIGVTDIEFVRAEGLAYGPDQRATALDGAHASVGAAVVGRDQALAA
jgi:FMN-dependent NADH-azoreductase